eukprot:5380953-Amphidinium_carterae.1
MRRCVGTVQLGVEATFAQEPELGPHRTCQLQSTRELRRNCAQTGRALSGFVIDTHTRTKQSRKHA